MRFRTALSLTTLFLVSFTVAAWSTPSSSQPASNLRNPTPDNQSVAGKIKAVGDAEFSLEVAKGEKQESMRFLVDGDTKVQGKLEVGAQASVEYRTEEEHNIAVRVVVTPASRITPY